MTPGAARRLEAGEGPRKKEHLKVEGLEKIRKIKASINKASTSFARFVSGSFSEASTTHETSTSRKD
jgi:hypothetical protein